MKLALATCAELADLFPSDRLLAAALRDRGFDAVPWIWDQPMPDGIGAVVIRTIWDYWHKEARFRHWLDELETAGTRVINPVETLRWNLDKHYLFELAAAGIALPRTEWLDTPRPLSEVFEAIDGEVVVIKPAVSAGGHDTFLIRRDDDTAQGRVDALVRRGPVLAQELIEEVADGEISLLFFDGVYSHSILKRAAPGEFRIHIEYGGTVEAIEVARDLVAQAQRVVDVLPTVPAYARVDGLVRDDTLVLMELELIEPELFFDYREGSAEAFAAVLQRRLDS